jgi:hypothetical protein
MITDQKIIELAKRFVDMSDPIRLALRETFSDSEFRFHGVTVTGEQDIRFHFLCKSEKLPNPWILSIHVIGSPDHKLGGYVVFADVVEEESGAIWWQCDQLHSVEEGLPQFMAFFMGALMSGAHVSCKRWLKYKGDYGTMQAEMVMDS